MRTGFEHIWQRATYESYLRRLDARAVLDHYGATNRQEQISKKDGSTEIIHSCLLDRVHPHHSNGDQSPSASCNIDKKTYVCYSMGYGCDLLHLINKLEGKEEFADSLMMVGQFLTGSTVEVGVFQQDLEKIFSAPTYLPTPLPTYDESILKGFEHPHPYWGQRGITQQAQETLKLGYDPKENRIVFPHTFDTHLVGWQKRSVDKNDFPKYKSSFGFPKSTTLYNYDRAREYSRVCVVESPMSVAKAISYDIPNVVATFGAKINASQIRLLYPFETVYVWMDDDEKRAGQTGERKLIEGLYRHTEVQVVIPDRDRDLADCPLEEIAYKIDTAVPAALRLADHDLIEEMS
jgi:hypothetical protein